MQDGLDDAELPLDGHVVANLTRGTAALEQASHPDRRFFVYSALAKFVGFDAVPWLLALAGAFLLVGVLSRRGRPWWSFPFQAAAMLVLGIVSVLETLSAPVFGGLLVAGALLGHAAWDIHHHRVDRVVGRSFSQFFAVLDILVAVILVAVVLVP